MTSAPSVSTNGALSARVGGVAAVRRRGDGGTLPAAAGQRQTPASQMPGASGSSPYRLRWQSRGAPVDVLDADRVELVRAGVETRAIGDGVRDLVEQGRGRIAHHRPHGIAVASRLELRAQVRVPDDPSALVGAIGAREDVARGVRARADLVAAAGAAREGVEDRRHLRGLAARVHAPSHAVERGGDPRRVGRGGGAGGGLGAGGRRTSTAVRSIATARRIRSRLGSTAAPFGQLEKPTGAGSPKRFRAFATADAEARN
jgi:hypothetical protein